MASLHRFNDAFWGAYLLLIFLPLIIKPFPYRSLFFAPILALTAYVLCTTTTGTYNGDYHLALGWLTLFCSASDYIVFTDVQRTLRRVSLNPAVPPPDSGPIEDASLWRRVWWAAALLGSPRGVGWSHEPVSALPPHPSASTPKFTFVSQRLARAVGFFLLHDACNLHRFIVGASWGMSAYTALVIGTSILSAGSVALGFSGPEEWPPLFGGPREARSIRRFWGRAWHQLMRRARPLFLLNRSSLCTGSTSHTMCSALAFFMLQACAITLEDLLIFLGKRAGMRESRATRAVGYAWTWAWFALVLPVCQVPLVRAGLMEEALPVSVLAGLWRGEWVLEPREGR
ncbi:hypothetical protein DFH07DRAFT_948222 [Mycena maculata]|uniref:Wax synthase domain-containing protein n=1 Tax=Mycena maculata TaxID=230809 RepID=A0AAD7KGT3_9AGAR|nr:hypothetical protein DFH07DRAFT_948222 [Mycena maculata]